MNQVKKPESGKDTLLAWCVLPTRRGPECGVKNFRQILRALKRSVLGLLYLKEKNKVWIYLCYSENANP